MKGVTIDIKSTAFPDQFVSDSKYSSSSRTFKLINLSSKGILHSLIPFVLLKP